MPRCWSTMKFQSIMYGIRPSITGQKGKEEGALAAYTQQIHLRVKGTVCASFSITSQTQKALKTSRFLQMVCCLVLQETAIAYGLLESDADWITAYLKHPFLLCQNNYSHYLSYPHIWSTCEPLDLWEKYKEVMVKISPEIFPLAHTMCNAEKQRCVMNEVLLCFARGAWRYGFIPWGIWPSKSQLGIPCAEGTKTILEEMFCDENQADIGRRKCE